MPSDQDRALILARRARLWAALCTPTGLALLGGAACGTAPSSPAHPQASAARSSRHPAASATGSATAAPPPIDTDGDGVVDAADHCPDVVGVPSLDAPGCPARPCLSIVPASAIEVREKIVFARDQARIRPESLQVLDAVARALMDHPEIELAIEGHGDSSEPAWLSGRRALAVLAYLVEAGVARERLTAQGFGESRPLAPNLTAAGREQNRRVDFRVTAPR